MKKKLTIALLFIVGLAYGQTPTNYLYRATRERVIAGIWDSTATVPSGIFPTLRGGGSGRAGALFVDTIGGGAGLHVYRSATWFRLIDSTELADTAAALRIIIGSGGGSGTVSPGLANKLAYYPASGTTIDDLPGLTPGRAMITDGDGLPNYSVVTGTELNYLSGVTSSVQTQLDGKQPLDADLTTIAGLTATTDNFIQSKAGAWASRTIAQVKSDLGLTGTNTGDQTISLTGDATGSGTGAIAVTLSSVVAAGSCTSCNLTYDAKGRITVAANGTGGGASITVGTSGITGGTNTRIPFNDAGVYQEDAGLSYNKTTDALSVSGSIRLPNAQIFSTSSDGIAIGSGAAGTFGGGTATNFIAIGTQAGEALTSGSSNITIGKVSGKHTTTGDSNVFLGANTDTETGFYNTLIGHEIFQAGTTNTGNTSIGYRSYANGTSGTYNTTVGFQSFVQGTTGTDNAGLGESTGYGVTTGSNNIFLGAWAGAYLGNTSNTLVIQSGNQGGVGVGTIIGDLSNKRVGIAFTQGTALTESFEVNGNIKSGIAGTTAGRLKLAGSTSGIVTIQTAAAAGTYTLTLPTSDGGASEFLQTDGSGVLTWAAAGGSGSPGGSTTQVQYNNAGSFAGDAGMTYVAASDALTVTGSGTFASVKVWNGNNAAETTNTAVGNQAANAVTSGASLTAMGYRAAFVLTSGSQTTAIGYQALSSNTTGDYNTAVGSNALRDNVTGSNNTAVGIQALILNTGSSNTAIGYTALLGNVGGGQNTAAGFQALMANTSGNTNTAIGYNSGYQNTTGSNNTYVGYAAAGPTTQSGNTVIGAQVNIGTVSNTIAIGNGTGTIYARHDATNWTFTATNSIFTGSVSSGVAGSSIGSFKLSGNTSGVISINPQAAAGTYNFNMPTTAGTSGYLLTSAGGGSSAMTWTDPATLGGGMSNPLTTTGDIIYSSSGTTAARRAIGSTGDVLTVSGGVPTWVAPTVTAQGTWTPTIAGLANVASSNGPTGIYSRQGNVVTFSIWVLITPTAGSTNTSFTATLPIASDLVNATDVIGNATGTQNVTYGAGFVSAAPSTDVINIQFSSVNTSAHSLYITGQYTIQ
jgi:hypothetical protein